MTKRSYWMVFVALVAVLIAVPASSQPVKLGTVGSGSRVTLTVNYQRVATLGSRGHSKAASRAATGLGRLAAYARNGRTPNFSARRAAGGWAVLANGGVVVIAGPADARAAGVRRSTLARRWASSFARAWKTPLLRLASTNVVVPVGSTRAIKLSGAGRGPIQVAAEAAGGVTARVERGAISLSGLSPSTGTVTVSRDGATVTARYRVMRWAGTVKPLTLEVTGDAVPRDMLLGLVRSEAHLSVALEQRASSEILSVPVLPSVWRTGATLASSLKVRLSGPGYLSVDTSIPIRVSRRQLPTENRLELFYSNHPETVEAPQVLFRHAVADSTPVRLIYHHQNVSEQAIVIGVDLRNEGGQPIRVQLIDGAGDPSIDTVLAGHRSAYKFLKRMHTGAGIIVSIPAHGTRRVMAQRTRQGETASGLMLVRKLGAGVMTLSTVAEGTSSQGDTRGQADTMSVFPSPDKVVDAKYTVGGAWTYVPIGQNPVSNPAGLRLDGDYGVIYTVRLRLDNPTAVRRTVTVWFEPRAGEARAAMIIDGTLNETPSARPPEEIRVASVSLKPHQVRTLTLVTIPAGGGSYPAGLIVNG